MSIGENIKALRMKAEISQAKLSEEIGITQSMLCQIERGTKTVSLPLAKDISVALDCTIDGKTDNLTKLSSEDIIVSGGISGARNPYSDEAKTHAKQYYGLVRSMTTDVSKISKATGYSKEQIQEIKDFIFMKKHDLGGKELEYFEPDFMMGESWKRLIDGKPEPHDLVLLKHEIMEMELINQGYSQSDAHIITSKTYNYDKEAGVFYDKIKKYKTKK